MKRLLLFILILGVMHAAEGSATVYRALLVGEAYWGESGRQIDASIRDIKAMEGMLNTMNATPWQITSLMEPTRNEVLNGIQSSFAGSTEGDVCLFFYMGHGDEMSGDLICSDTILDLRSLKEALDAFPCKRIVILASCYSDHFIDQNRNLQIRQRGAMSQTDSEIDLDAINQNIINVFRLNVSLRSSPASSGEYLILTASANGGIAYAYNTGSDTVPGFTFFTYVLTEGSGYDELNLSGVEEMTADVSNDRFISLREAYIYCSERINILLEQYAPGQGLQQSVAAWPENTGKILWGRTQIQPTPSPKGINPTSTPSKQNLAQVDSITANMPKTGDSSHFLLFVALTLICSIAAWKCYHHFS